MKKLIPVIAIVLFAACNNASNSSHDHSGHASGDGKTPADSMMQLVMDGHDAAMPKMGKLSKAQTQVQQALDSINKLPAKAQQAAQPYKVKLDSLMSELKTAEDGMNRWMQEFVMDTLKNDNDALVKYLESEKNKVNAVKENIFSSLQKADSLFKK